MSTAAAQLRFAVEFATFLVAVAGGAIVLLRPDLVGAGRRSRSVLFFGFLAIAIAAFLHGSLLTDAREIPGHRLPLHRHRPAGVGHPRVERGPGTRRMLWVALVLMTLAECATVMDAATTSDWLRIFAALGLGAVLVMSARRSISARIAVSVGSILLVVVLAVSVALSVVIGRNVKEQGFDRIDARARAESAGDRRLRHPTSPSSSAKLDRPVDPGVAGRRGGGALATQPTASGRPRRDRPRPDQPVVPGAPRVRPARSSTPPTSARWSPPPTPTPPPPTCWSAPGRSPTHWHPGDAQRVRGGGRAARPTPIAVYPVERRRPGRRPRRRRPHPRP